MASVANRKRPNADRLSHDNPPAKRLKSAGRNRITSIFPPSFWDHLSKISLTSLALRELNHRNKLQHNSTTSTPSSVCVAFGDLARFARHGGPDLRHLRGFPSTKQGAVAMTSTPISSATSPSRRTPSTKATTTNGKSSAYEKNFELHLADHGVYMNDRTSQPGNISQIRSELAQERASLSPPRFSQSDFESFQRKSEDAVFESDTMAIVIPLICGNTNIANQQNILFTELEPITDENAVKPKPDFFDGARLLDLSLELRNSLNTGLPSTIIPTKHPGIPVAPNFLLEVKGPDGKAPVAKRQAFYDGEYGVRAIHDLQNFGGAEPIYDGNAYTYSSTYHAGTGTLQLYMHHATAPNTAGGRPEYHMTQIDGWCMTGSIDNFRCGATAFRNARDVAQRNRDAFIQIANSRAIQAATAVPEDATDGHAHEENPAPNEESGFADLSDYTGWRDADDALQEHIADASNCTY